MAGPALSQTRVCGAVTPQTLKRQPEPHSFEERPEGESLMEPSKGGEPSMREMMSLELAKERGEEVMRGVG